MSLYSSLVDKIVPQLEALLIEAAEHDRRLSERTLCEQLGVSRPIIREALSSLRRRGLVEIIPGKGIFPAKNIRQPTVLAMQDYLRRTAVGIHDLAEGRLFLETHIAETAALRRTDADVKTLRDAVGRMESGLQDVARFEQGDLDFHLALAAATHNELYLIWLQPIIGMLEGRRNRVVTLGEVRVRVLRAHQKIFAAVQAGDAVAARREMEEHLHAFRADAQHAIKLGLLPPAEEAVREAG